MYEFFTEERKAIETNEWNMIEKLKKEIKDQKEFYVMEIDRLTKLLETDHEKNKEEMTKLKKENQELKDFQNKGIEDQKKLYDKEIDRLTTQIEKFQDSDNENIKKLKEEYQQFKDSQKEEIETLKLQLQESNNKNAKEFTNYKENNSEIFEKLTKENQDLKYLNNELTIEVEQLREENKSYLEKIISSSKLSAETSLSRLKSPNERKEIILRQPSKKQFMKSRIANSRELTLKQLKESIEDIYTSKTKFDEKCYESRQPRETMDQFLYTYLNQKYGLKSLIAEWSVLILKSIEKYELQDSEISLFSKILKHKIDEDFRSTFEKLKENMKQLLKAKIQQRNPYIREVQLNAMLKEKMNGALDEDEWGTIVVSMFSKQESEFMIGHIKNLIEEKSGKLIIGRRNQLLSRKSDASYYEVQNAILNYDLSAHEALLEPFWKEFVAFDSDKNGVLTEDEFRNLCNKIGILEDIERLLDEVDPNATGFINFSDCVILFNYEMVDGGSNSVLHSLFFQSQKLTS